MKTSVSRQTHDAKAEGFTVLTKKQNEELFAWGQFNSDEFARLDYTVPWEVSEHLRALGGPEGSPGATHAYGTALSAADAALAASTAASLSSSSTAVAFAKAREMMLAQ